MVSLNNDISLPPKTRKIITKAYVTNQQLTSNFNYTRLLLQCTVFHFVFSAFYRSLRPKYIRDVDNSVLRIEVKEAGYVVLASRLLGYFNTSPNDRYVPRIIFFRSPSLIFFSALQCKLQAIAKTRLHHLAFLLEEDQPVIFSFKTIALLSL